MLYREPALTPTLVTVADAAKILGATPVDVDRLIQAGEVEASLTPAGRRAVDVASLDAYRKQVTRGEA